MTRGDPVPAKAAFVPLLLVIGYSAVIMALPGVSPAGVLELTASHLLRNLAVMLVILAVAAVVLTKRGWRERWPMVILPYVYLALLLASFSTYKQIVLPSAGFGLDAAFADIDRLLFFGAEPWRLTHRLVSSAQGTWVVDMAYLFWFLPMLFFVLLSWMAPPRLQVRYLIAFALVWIVAGTVLAFLLPGSGPCYVEAFHSDQRFAPLMDRLNTQSQFLSADGGAGLLALTGQQGLLSAYQENEFIFAGGISAMPSLHVALAVLFACAGFACHRGAGWILAGFAFVIWFGSVHLGWHYAVDGVVGGLAAVLMWKLAGVWTARLCVNNKAAAEAWNEAFAAPAS